MPQENLVSAKEKSSSHRGKPGGESLRQNSWSAGVGFRRSNVEFCATPATLFHFESIETARSSRFGVNEGQ